MQVILKTKLQLTLTYLQTNIHTHTYICKENTSTDVFNIFHYHTHTTSTHLYVFVFTRKNNEANDDTQSAMNADAIAGMLCEAAKSEYIYVHICTYIHMYYLCIYTVACI